MDRISPKAIAIIAAAAAFALVGAAASNGASSGASSGASVTTAATKTVNVRDDSYSHSSLSIHKGQKVQWNWKKTRDKHNVTTGSAPVSFSSPTKKGNFSFTHKFTKAGTYKIFCSIHPDLMKIKVTVKK
jgi:plastocyanin